MIPHVIWPSSLAFASALPLCMFAQTPDPQSPQARIAQMLNESPGAWTPAQIANMERLRDAALNDPYALTELRHLTDNIGPRLAGSPQAQHAVEWVAEEMRALGATVTIEKTTVPHWVRGEETAELTGVARHDTEDDAEDRADGAGRQRRDAEGRHQQRRWLSSIRSPI